MAQYEYETLRDAASNSRFVSLLPGSGEDAIELFLLEENLDEMSDLFEALSYCWGDPTPTHSLLIANWEFKVTENLHSALRRLRFMDRERVLWIDALCINQADANEKSKQVGLMGKIYCLAKRVLLWLGEDQIVRNTPIMRQQFGAPEVVGSMADRIDDMVFQAIIQELAFAKEIMIHCGKFAWSWEGFRNAPGVLKKSAGPYSNFMRFGDFVEKMDEIRDLQPSATDLDFHRLLREFRKSQASDRRDKVYGLISMSDFKLLRIDYTLGFHEVYFDVLQVLVNEHKSLNFLADCHAPGLNPRGMPSWFPNWAADNNGWGDFKVGDPAFRASFDRKAELRSKLQPPWDDKHHFIADAALIVHGIKLSTFTERPTTNVDLPFKFGPGEKGQHSDSTNISAEDDPLWNPSWHNKSIVCIIFGCDVPIGLDAVERKGKLAWRIVGDVFRNVASLEGYLQGKAVNEIQEGRWREEWFTLV
ncbi:MAG: hypothetical protein M1820_002472 [Bogoriella megaspora]|nr:MAG: hypothetical protein M1820_002472 [Bogoriella megaspora]